MKEHFASIITSIGEDLNRPGLQDTPERAAKAFQFLTRGYNQTIDEVVNGALFPSDSSGGSVTRRKPRSQWTSTHS